MKNDVIVFQESYSSIKPGGSLVSMNNQYGIWIMKLKFPKFFIVLE